MGVLNNRQYKRSRCIYATRPAEPHVGIAGIEPGSRKVLAGEKVGGGTVEGGITPIHS